MDISPQEIKNELRNFQSRKWSQLKKKEKRKKRVCVFRSLFRTAEVQSRHISSQDVI